jgi:hypothetical protein
MGFIAPDGSRPARTLAKPARLKKKEWQDRSGNSDFWRPLRYERDGGIV